MPEPKTLHKDAVMTNLSIAYRNEDLIWRRVMPVVKVSKRSDLYFKYNKEDSYRIPNDQLGPKSDPNEVDWGVATDNYSVKGHGLGDWIPQEAIDNADNPLQPEIDTNDFLNNCLELAQEQRVANIVFSSGSYPAAQKTQLSGTAQWGGSADDPVGNLLTAIEACFVRANTVVMGADTWKKFRALPEVLDAVKGSTRYQGSPGGLATVAECAGLFEVENWLVGRSRYNAANAGQTASFARLWGKHCAALYVPKNPGLKTIGFGFTFMESDKQTFRVFDGKKGEKGAHYFKVTWNSDEKIIASDCGYFIQDAVA